MSKLTNRKKKAGSKDSHEPRPLGSIVEEMLHGNSPLAVGYRQYIASQENGDAKKQGWHANTDLGCDLKTILRSGHMMTTGKKIPGVLRLDSEASIEDFCCRDAHYTFIETQPVTAGKRNLHVFDGKFITVTCRDDGSLRPNFKPMKVDKDFNVEHYASSVANELLWALGGLVEEADSE